MDPGKSLHVMPPYRSGSAVIGIISGSTLLVDTDQLVRIGAGTERSVLGTGGEIGAGGRMLPAPANP